MRANGGAVRGPRGGKIVGREKDGDPIYERKKRSTAPPKTVTVREAQDAAMKLGADGMRRVLGHSNLSGATMHELVRLVEAARR